MKITSRRYSSKIIYVILRVLLDKQLRYQRKGMFEFVFLISHFLEIKRSKFRKNCGPIVWFVVINEGWSNSVINLSLSPSQKVITSPSHRLTTNTNRQGGTHSTVLSSLQVWTGKKLVIVLILVGASWRSDIGQRKSWYIYVLLDMVMQILWPLICHSLYPRGGYSTSTNILLSCHFLRGRV